MTTTPTIQQQLCQPFDRTAWREMLHRLFPDGSVKLFATPQALAASQENIAATLQLGTITLPDDKTIALLEVETSDQIKLARNRVGLRNFVASFIDEAGAAAVLAVFHQKDSPDWRLTYASRQTTLDEDTFEITTIETAPRRFTFLLGENEPCRTAAARLAGIQDKGDALALPDVEKAFSVETLTKDFFKKYKEHYQGFVAHLLSPAEAATTRESFGIPVLDDDKEQEKADKPIRDFVKTLLGRLVFLHFLQKKGWLGCPKGGKKWKGGDADFLQSYLSLAKAQGELDFFHSKYLCPLFFEALNKPDRTGDLFPLTGSRLPYLNGGLFEEDGDEHRGIDFPGELFARLLDFFGEYNFTIDENDPEDHEVGIDPEMLGHIFENLLEDNKDKGAFYTPKAIVSYMARQSLLHYLQTHLGEDPQLEKLLNEKDLANHPAGSFVATHKTRIGELLDEVKICDPAIGSGAFPIGLLQEILWTRLALQPELNTPPERAKLKRRIIQHSIHGVDIDPGAIEIARLRFWLALVVDEDEPRPLPNLDYKIHRADSLIEYIRGEPVNLGTEAPKDGAARAAVEKLIAAKQALFTAQKLPDKRAAWFDLYRALAQLAQAEFTWMRNGTDFTDGERMALLTKGIHEFGQWIGKIDSIRREKVHHQETLLRQLRAWFDDIDKPTFLWNLHFGEIFARGGFDVVVANPPYVRHETIKPIKPLLKDRFVCFKGTADLFTYFYEQAARLLRQDGVLTFITSNKYYRAGYGDKLRGHLAENLTLHTLLDFADAPVFDAIAYASILVGTKSAPPADSTAQAYIWKPDDKLSTLERVMEKQGFELKQSSLTADCWRLESSSVQDLLAKLRGKGVALDEYVGGRFYYGIKTGLNEAFVIDAAKRDELIAADPKSAEVIKPFLRGKDVKRWKAGPAQIYLIKIESSQNAKHAWNNASDSWSIFKRTFPSIALHFEALKGKNDSRGVSLWERLKSRDDQGKYFWELRSCAYWGEFLKPKVVYQEIATFQAFALDESNSLSNNKTFFLPETDHMEIAILNSKVTWWFLGKIATKMVGGAYAMQWPFVSQIRLPQTTPADKARLAELAASCAEAAKKDDVSSLAVLEAEINQIVYRLFDLTPEEIALIESSLAS